MRNIVGMTKEEITDAIHHKGNYLLLQNQAGAKLTKKHQQFLTRYTTVELLRGLCDSAIEHGHEDVAEDVSNTIIGLLQPLILDVLPKAPKEEKSKKAA